MDFVDVAVDLLVEVLGFDDFVYEAVLMRFLCGNGLTEEEHLSCLFLRRNRADKLHSWC